MARLLFPELRDEDWLLARIDRSYTDIARALGCDPGTVGKAFRRLGIYRSRPWSPLERQIVEELYPDWYGRLIAKALGRSLTSFWATVCHRWDLDPGDRRDKRPEAEFWPFWRSYVAQHLREWTMNGQLDIAERFVLRPRQTESVPCRSCRLRADCENALGVLCADLTLGDILAAP